MDVVAQSVSIQGTKCSVDPSVLLQARVKLVGNQRCSVGPRNIIEDGSIVEESSIGEDNIVGVRCILQECILGNSNSIGSGCDLRRVKLGDRCNIAAGLKLRDLDIPTHSSVFMHSSEGLKMVVLKDDDPSSSAQAESFIAYYNKLKELKPSK